MSSTAQILEYGVNLFADGQAYFRLHLSTGDWHTVHLTDPAIARNWMDMLRNEGPVHLVPQTNVIFTGREPVGEAES